MENEIIAYAQRWANQSSWNSFQALQFKFIFLKRVVMLPSNCEDGEGVCGHGQRVPPPVLSCPVLFAPLTSCCYTLSLRAQALPALCRANRCVCVWRGRAERHHPCSHLWALAGHFPLHDLASQTMPVALTCSHLSLMSVSKFLTHCSARHHQNTSVQSGKVRVDHKEQLSSLQND